MVEVHHEAADGVVDLPMHDLQAVVPVAGRELGVARPVSPSPLPLNQPGWGVRLELALEEALVGFLGVEAAALAHLPVQVVVRDALGVREGGLEDPVLEHPRRHHPVPIPCAQGQVGSKHENSLERIFRIAPKEPTEKPVAPNDGVRKVLQGLVQGRVPVGHGDLGVHVAEQDLDPAHPAPVSLGKRKGGRKTV